MEYDIVFLHPPSTFTKLTYPLGGVFAAQTGTTDYFVGMPVGLVNMAHQLLRNGFQSKIVNMAEYLRAHGRAVNVEDIIAGIDAKGYGLDLHWAVHTPGALDLAAMVKKKKPGSFVFLGGLTATFFHEEILKNLPYIDGVMLAECDDAIVDLAAELNKAKRDLSSVPNLAHRVDSAIVKKRVIMPALDDFNFYDYYSVVEPTPILSRHLMLPAIRGCNWNCPFCGGSGFSYGKFGQRKKPIALSPEKLCENIKRFIRRGGQYVNLLGDIRCAGRHYVDELLTRIADFSHKVSIKSELFSLADRPYLEKWSDHAGHLNFVLSPESGDPAVMKALGKDYTPDDVEQQVKWCSELGIDLALSFLYALPGQSIESVKGTLGFIERMLNLPDSRAGFMFEPMLFIDPGSMIFHEPEKWGYANELRTLSDIDRRLRKPHWSGSLGYSTRWMSKKEIIEAIFLVNSTAAKWYFESGEITGDAYRETLENIALNRRVVAEIERNGDTDNDRIGAFIKEIFPPNLLKDNGLIKYSYDR